MELVNKKVASLIASLVAYLIGSIPTGLLVSRLKYGMDVREVGSGNIGATNVTRAFGWGAGVFTFLLDFLKGFVPVLFVQRLFPERPSLEAWVAGFAVLGHCHSLFLGFRGGKGVATGLGSLALVMPWAALCATVVYVLLVALTKVSALGSLAGVFVVFLYAAKAPPSESLLALVVCLIIVIRHQTNLRHFFAIFANRYRGGER